MGVSIEWRVSGRPIERGLLSPSHPESYTRSLEHLIRGNKMARDECFVPCAADVLINKELISTKNASEGAPVKINIKGSIKKPMDMAVPV